MKTLADTQREWVAQPEATRGHSVFRGVKLSGADVFWLAERVRGKKGGYVGALHLERADLTGAHLEGAKLRGAWLIGADLSNAYLEGADLTAVRLQGTTLYLTHLEGASVRRTWLDNNTNFDDAFVNDRTQLGDIHWDGVGNVNLTRVHWAGVSRLGDEYRFRRRTTLEQSETVVRAYRQLATQLRAQGMSEVADRFLYRANVRQRRVYLRRFQILQYLGSLLLDLISGHGFKPGRSFLTYVLVILAFAAAFFAIGTGILGIGGHEAINSPVSALVFSVTSFHGRGFFPGDLQLDAGVTVIAACEAVIGLIIEVSFIATFTQRFFAR
ncbi:MAG TPA: pentapeptide repeat-containing protein [Ktedonobacterales bacterium]